MAWGEANPQLIELVQSLHRITGLKFVIYNASRQILASEPPTMCTFCTEIRKSPVLAQRCLVCDAAGFDRCDRTGQPCTYHCHMNVQEMIAPIRDKQYRIGYVMIGQFLDYDDRTELHRRAADAAAQFGLDRARLDRGAEELQRYDEAYLRSVMQLLEMSASYIWMNQILDVSRDSLLHPGTPGRPAFRRRTEPDVRAKLQRAVSAVEAAVRVRDCGVRQPLPDRARVPAAAQHRPRHRRRRIRRRRVRCQLFHPPVQKNHRHHPAPVQRQSQRRNPGPRADAVKFFKTAALRPFFICECFPETKRILPLRGC